MCACVWWCACLGITRSETPQAVSSALSPVSVGAQKSYKTLQCSWVLSKKMLLRILYTLFASSSLRPANSISLTHKNCTSQPAVLFSHNKSAPPTSTSQPNTVLVFSQEKLLLDQGSIDEFSYHTSELAYSPFKCVYAWMHRIR